MTSSINAIYVEHHSWLRRFLCRRTGCMHLAADITQDVFVRLLTRDSFPEIREPRAFLARIAHGLVADQWRRAAVERAWLQTMASLDFAVPSPDEQAEIVEALVRIDALLGGLKPRAREAFLLSRLDGLTYPQIAERLSVSLSTVEKDMALAMRHFYRLLID
ncbi:MAG: sigma-70 family RNA polymerase sigma factor [Kiloniellales bacterium]